MRTVEDGKLRSLLLRFAGMSACVAAVAISAAAQTVVQPGAPGEPTKVLPGSTRASLTALSPKDIEFMQGMIMHHGQAVEMTALIAERSVNTELRRLGDRISHTQADEMRFMERWLAVRGQATKMTMDGHDHEHMDDMDMGDMDMSGDKPAMPGMLTKKQMKALGAAKGKEFDRLFLEGMIQHHGGALTMVKDLFETPGAGQDAEIFNFATDVDSGQRAEIRIMQGMLKKL
jgi:uncharacterized protein (DUF305 family)